MANVTFKVAINNAEFPLVFGTDGQEVLDPGYDVASRTNPVFAGGSGALDWNMIQVQYVHGHVPTEKGYRSVKRVGVASGAAPATAFDLHHVAVARAIPVSSSWKAYFAGRRQGGTWGIYSYENGTWVDLGISEAHAGGTALVYAAQVNAALYLLLRYNWNGSTANAKIYTGAGAVVAPVWPAGVVTDDVIGIFGAGNYMIALTKTQVLWSTPTNPLDFSDTTLGAGRQSPTDQLDPILAGGPTSGGFLIYTRTNTIAAFFTNSAATPFLFKPVPDGQGTLYPTGVTVPVGDGPHYVWTSLGLQRVTLRKADHIFKKLTELIAGDVYTKITTATTPPTLAVAGSSTAYHDIGMALVGTRYLLVLARDQQATLKQSAKSILLDLVSNRATLLPSDGRHLAWIPNSYSEIPSGAYVDQLTDVVEFPATYLASTANLVFKYALPDALDVAVGVAPMLVVGPIRLRRGKVTTITEVSVQGTTTPNAVASSDLTCHVWTYQRVGGEAGEAVQLTRTDYDSKFQTFQGRVTGEVLYVALTGQISVTAITVTAQAHGIR